jgi:spectinomycin phosphotransferase
MPVGWGDHHWELTDCAGRRWFVTVAGLTGRWRGTGPAAGYTDLQAAMDTVVALAGAGLEFAVAPVPTTDGRALAPLGAEHAITVFPYLDGACGDDKPPQGRLGLIDMLARLHNATPLARGTAPVRRPDLATPANSGSGARGAEPAMERRPLQRTGPPAAGPACIPPRPGPGQVR